MKENKKLLIAFLLLIIASILIWFVLSNLPEDFLVSYSFHILLVILFLVVLYALWFANLKIYKKYYLTGDLADNLIYYRELIDEYSSLVLYNLLFLIPKYPHLMI